MSHRYGRGRDLFEPAVCIAIEGGRITLTNPGHRERWDLRPTWHGLVYAGKSGTGAECVVSSEAVHSWPVVFDETGKIRRAPKESKHRDAVVSESKVAKPYRRRRTSAQLRQDIIDLKKRGLLLTAIADQLNVADRRVKEILAGAVAA